MKIKNMFCFFVCIVFVVFFVYFFFSKYFIESGNKYKDLRKPSPYSLLVTTTNELFCFIKPG